MELKSLNNRFYSNFNELASRMLEVYEAAEKMFSHIRPTHVVHLAADVGALYKYMNVIDLYT